MKSRRAFATLLSVGLVCAQGTAPKSKSGEYPAQAALPKLALGAEYLVRSFSGRSYTFIARDYLVVEVALFPAPGTPVAVTGSQFTLRINGKQTLAPHSTGFVAASMKYPDWERRPTLIAGGGLGDRGVILGQPQPVERFPGDPRPQQGRLPRPPQAPAEEDRSGLDPQPVVQAHEVAVDAALPEGDAKGPVSGYLYFPHKGKTRGIRSLELLYQGPGGSATMRLLPLAQ